MTTPELDKYKPSCATDTMWMQMKISNGATGSWERPETQDDDKNNDDHEGGDAMKK